MTEALLTILRDRQTPVEPFRQASLQLADILASEAAPLALHQRAILIPILRAGVALLPSFLKHFPQAPVGFFGIRRDEKTALPHLYYANLPQLHPTDVIFLLDPMIATAGTALLAIDQLIKKGIPPSKIVLVSVIGSLEGIQKIKKAHPYLTIIIAAEDPELDAQKYIVPGLGDFGDRYFLT